MNKELSGDQVMKIRICVLCFCMVVIPAIAMFSHRIPRHVRVFAKQHLWVPLHDQISMWIVISSNEHDEHNAVVVSKESVVDTETKARENPLSDPNRPSSNIEQTDARVVSSKTNRLNEFSNSALLEDGTATSTNVFRSLGSTVVMPVISLGSPNAITPPAERTGPGLAVPVSIAEESMILAVKNENKKENQKSLFIDSSSLLAAKTETIPQSLPPQAPQSSRQDLKRESPPPVSTPLESQESNVVQRKVRQRLVSLGAVSVETGVVASETGMHRCSCRVSADPTGQLQRVFQTTDHDPSKAMLNLLEQVESWKYRLAIEKKSDDGKSSRF